MQDKKSASGRNRYPHLLRPLDLGFLALPDRVAIIGAGRESRRDLASGLEKRHHLIGGADRAAGLDAAHAIDQGFRLGLVI